MNVKDRNQEKINQVIYLLKSIEIEGDGHDQGFLFVWGQENGDKTEIKAVRAGCPNCTIPHVLGTAMDSDNGLQQIVLKSIAKMAKTQANNFIKPGKDQKN